MKLNDGRCSFTLARTIHSCYVSMVLDHALTAFTYSSAFDRVRYSRDDNNFFYLLFFFLISFKFFCIWFLFTVALFVMAMRKDQLFVSQFFFFALSCNNNLYYYWRENVLRWFGFWVSGWKIKHNRQWLWQRVTLCVCCVCNCLNTVCVTF